MSSDNLTATTSPAPSGIGRREHRYDIDLLRLICAGFVILLHVSGDYVTIVDTDPSHGAAVYWTGIVANSMSRFAVPLFFAMAGWAVLFGAPPKDGRRLAQRIVRVVVPLFVWTALYLAWGRVRGSNDGSAMELAGRSLLASIEPAYHLWYLYSYVPVILLLGFVVLIKAGRRPWGVAAALAGFASAGVQVTAVEQTTGWQWPVVEWNFGLFHLMYAVVGALVLTLDGSRIPRWAWAVTATAALGGVIWFQHAVNYVIPNANLLTAVFSFAVAMTVSRLRVPERFRPWIGRLSAASFGAYLVHLMILRLLSERFLSPGLGWAAATGLLLGITAATIALSFGASLLWGKLPRLRGLLG